jgi:hypothetical protein
MLPVRLGTDSSIFTRVIVVARERVDKSNLDASVHLELCGVDRGLVRFLGRHVA